MSDPIWPWADLHQSSVWPWLHNVSTSETLAKGEDYQTISVVKAVFAGDWGNAQIVQLLDDCGHTPESLYAESLGRAQEQLIHIEQLRAIRTKSMLQLQGAYEALVNRSILRERLHMQNELMRRDLGAIEVKANTAGVDLELSN